MPDHKRETGCYLRRATSDDIDLLFEWANDKETRRNSFSSQTIPRDEHEKWFTVMLNDPNRIQYIMMDDNTPVGQIRLDITDREAEISYSIAPTQRRKGYGREILRLIKEQAQKDCPSAIKLRGLVKPHNTKSVNCFESNGFKEKYKVFEIDMIDISIPALKGETQSKR